MIDLKFPLLCKWVLRSSGVKRNVEWWLVTDISEKKLGSIFNGTETSVTTNLRCVTSQKKQRSPGIYMYYFYKDFVFVIGMEIVLSVRYELYFWRWRTCAEVCVLQKVNCVAFLGTVVLAGRIKNVLVFIPALSRIYLHVIALYESQLKFFKPLKGGLGFELENCALLGYYAACSGNANHRRGLHLSKRNVLIGWNSILKFSRQIGVVVN